EDLRLLPALPYPGLLPLAGRRLVAPVFPAPLFRVLPHSRRDTPKCSGYFHLPPVRLRHIPATVQNYSGMGRCAFVRPASRNLFPPPRNSGVCRKAVFLPRPGVF